MKKLISILFSRYAFSIILIAIKIFVMIYVGLYLSNFSLLLSFLALLIDLFVLVSIITSDMNPEYRLSWVSAVLIFPVVGVVFYLIFAKARMSRAKRRLYAEISSGLVREDGELSLSILGKSDPMAAGKARAILNIDKIAGLYTGTESKYYSLGEDMYKDMISAIDSAKSYIFLEYFIIEDGKMWQGIWERIEAKARTGVEIRLMYDDVGCMKTMPDDFAEVLNEAGINARPFMKVSPYLVRTQNNRDHRKILVVDGRVGFTGGVNIADEYINVNSRLGHWKDGGIRLTGDAVRGLVALFLSLWDMNRGEKGDYSKYLDAFKCKERFTDGGFYLPFGSGPYPEYEREVGKRAIIDLVNQARRYVYITSPYLIIGYELIDALVGAAERGVDVRIILPHTADKKFIKAMSRATYPSLISRGVRIYEYTPGFIHQKLFVVDDEYLLIGTINLDYRSFAHHYEDAVWIYNSPTVFDARRDIEEVISVSELMTEKSSRPSFFEWLTNAFLRIFAPLF